MSTPNPPDTPAPAATPAQLARQITEIHAMLTELRADWLANKPVLEAFRRGGMLAARTAARHQRKERDTP